MSFNNNYKKTELTIRNLTPNYRYYFRVKARNGNGIETCYNYDEKRGQQPSYPPNCANPPEVSTITVGISLGLAEWHFHQHQ
jgi:hypothetical protein